MPSYKAAFEQDFKDRLSRQNSAYFSPRKNILSKLLLHSEYQTSLHPCLQFFCLSDSSLWQKGLTAETCLADSGCTTVSTVLFGTMSLHCLDKGNDKVTSRVCTLRCSTFFARSFSTSLRFHVLSYPAPDLPEKGKSIFRLTYPEPFSTKSQQRHMRIFPERYVLVTEDGSERSHPANQL